MRRRAAVERVADMGVAQVVRRDRSRRTGPRRGTLHDAVDLRRIERTALRGSKRRVMIGRLAAERGQLAPDRRRQHDDPRLAALAEHRDLSGARGAALCIAPAQAANL